jgi:hypothetical protein
MMTDLAEVIILALIVLGSVILTFAFYAIIVAVVIYIALWLLQMFGVIALMAVI